MSVIADTSEHTAHRDAASRYPNLYISFQTSFTSPEALIGYILIPISCVILCFGTGLVLLCKDKVPLLCSLCVSLPLPDSPTTVCCVAVRAPQLLLYTAEHQQLVRRSGQYVACSMYVGQPLPLTLFACAGAADSEVSVPMPTAQGRSMIRRNGSFTNLSALLPGVKTADFTSNGNAQPASAQPHAAP